MFFFVSLHFLIKTIVWSVRLGVRTSGFHPGNRGSIPLPTTISIDNQLIMKETTQNTTRFNKRQSFLGEYIFQKFFTCKDTIFLSNTEIHTVNLKSVRPNLRHGDDAFAEFAVDFVGASVGDV